MSKALTPEQADKIIPKAERAAAREAKALRLREEAAVQELDELGFVITVHEPRRFVEPDPLRNEVGGWRSGVCHAVAYAEDGRRKNISGISAVQVLDEARSWVSFLGRLKPDAPNRFVIVKGGSGAVPVKHRQGSENARRERGADDVRKVISFASGVPEVVESRGTPVGDTASPASQFRPAALDSTKGADPR